MFITYNFPQNPNLYGKCFIVNSSIIADIKYVQNALGYISCLCICVDAADCVQKSAKERNKICAGKRVMITRIITKTLIVDKIHNYKENLVYKL